MMKRLFAAILLVCFVCLAFAACGETDLEKSQGYIDDHPLPEKKLYSVSFALVSDAPINEAALSDMQLRFNEYTEANYNIHVEFTNVTAAQYSNWLNNKFQSVEEAYNARIEAEEAAAAAAAVEIPEGGETDATGTAEVATAAATTAAATTGAGSLGSDIRDVYPEIGEDQFDLIYIADYAMFADLVNKGRLRDLTAELTSKDYRLIKSNMTEKFFNATILNGKIYAVPNCRVMANYKYMIVNAEKATYYNFMQDNFDTYASTEKLRDVIAKEGGDPAEFVKQNLVGDYAARFELAENGTYWVYDTAKAQKPTINQSDLMNGMLAVTAYAYVDDGGTKLTDEDDFCPAVKILYAIDTEKDLHTILQYGVRGQTYSLKNGVVEKIVGTDYTYEINSKYTGNVFSLYPTEEQAEQVANWRLQNNDTVITTDIYSVSVLCNEEQGTVHTSAAFGRQGEAFTLTAEPNEGFSFLKWTYVGSEGEPVDYSFNASYSGYVPEGGIELTAVFAAAEEPAEEEAE